MLRKAKIIKTFKFFQICLSPKVHKKFSFNVWSLDQNSFSQIARKNFKNMKTQNLKFFEKLPQVNEK